MTASAVTVAVEPYEAPDSVALVVAVMADVEDRYADSDPWSGRPIPPPGARPSPVAAPPGDPMWAIAPADVTPPRGAFAVARIAGRAVGCGAVRPLPGGDRRIGEIKRVYAAPDARRRGVARAVMAHLTDLAPTLGFDRLVLETGTGQPEALGLYGSLGWYPVAAYGEFASALDSRCFGLDLAAQAAAGSSSRPNSAG